MRSKMVEIGVVLALSLPPFSSCSANGFKGMAKELARAALKAKIDRVAVLPFIAAGSGASGDGWNISEKLITQLVQTGKVQAVERSLLRNLMDEHHLAQTGAVDQTTVKKLGRIFSAEGIVTGSFVAIGREAVVNARLINVETGVIIAAVERRVDREWLDSAAPRFAIGQLASVWVPAPEMNVEIPSLMPVGAPELRDAPADGSCEGASDRVDRLESEILDLKARYWAGQLKKGGALTQVKVNPGSTITDPSIKKAFYDRLKYWYDLDDIPALTPSEVQRFVSIDGKAYSLYRECGV